MLLCVRSRLYHLRKKHNGNCAQSIILEINNLYISPCISVCHINKDTRLCDGCGRSIEEITEWSKMSHHDRMIVMKSLGYGSRKKR